MENSFSHSTKIHARQFILALDILALVFPVLSILGWMIGVKTLSGWGQGFIPMAPGEAFCFIVLSVGLISVIRFMDGPVANRAASFSGLLVSLYGLLVVIQWISSMQVWPEDVVMKIFHMTGGKHSGHMPPVSGLLFMLSGFSLTALVLGIPNKKHSGKWLAAAGFTGLGASLTGFIIGMSYYLGKPFFYESAIIPVSLPAALSFMFLGLCICSTAILHGPASGRWYSTINDMSIGIQLYLGLGLELLLVGILGILSYEHSSLMWANTKTLYEHTLKIQKTIGTIESDILAIQGAMKDLLLHQYEQEVEESLQDLESRKADVLHQIGSLKDSYLGPYADVAVIMDGFVKWCTVNDETIRLIRMDKISAARNRTLKTGVGGLQGEHLLDGIKVVDDYVSDKAVQLYNMSHGQKQNVNRQLFLILSVILIMAYVIAWKLLKAIKEPLRHLTTVSESLRQGKLDTRSQYMSANEFGILSHAFNTLAETIETQNRLNGQVADINAAMIRETEIRPFCRELMTGLIRHTMSCISAVYIYDEKRNIFDQYESIGLQPGHPTVIQGDSLDGALGLVAATRKIQRLTEIPDDTIYTISTVAGEMKPREILTIPMISDQGVMTVLVLGSVHGYQDETISLVEGILPTVSTRLNGVLAYRKIKVLTEDLERRNQLLQSQQEELRVANEELEEQTRRLLQSEEELKAQHEELQVSNEELEEKSDLLARQKAEIEKSKKSVEEKAEALSIASKYKSEFLANMSHELRTPLNSLLLLAQGLMKNKEGNLTPDQVESARIIYGGGNELLNLINDILDLAKIEAGRVDLHQQSIKVNDIVDNIRDSFQHMAEEKGIALDIVVADSSITEINTDNKRLAQIIRNLVGNALKFTEKGSITVTFDRPGPDVKLAVKSLNKDNCVSITVRDTGIGIPPELHAAIFEAFQQADGSTSRKYGGTGLGLSISRELANLLGGEIHLQSEPGQGAAFTIYIPMGAGNLAIQKPVQVPVRIKKTAAKPRPVVIPDDRHAIGESDRVMLVIEDDSEFAKLIHKKCHEKGFRCILTSTGEEGLELADRYLPSAVILDIGLPGMDGWEVLNSLKENTRTRHIPVHIVSAEDASNRSMNKGAVGHAVKPIDYDELEATFQRLEKMEAGKPKYLLVVDDDAVLRKETVKLIGNGDVTSFEAESGEKALEILQTIKVDCMVLDLGLPDMDGGELLARIEKEGISVPPVVIYTARELTMNEEASIRERAESIVIKDVRSQERLLDEVSLFLHRVVSQMPEQNRKVIQSLHDTDSIFKDKKVLVVDDDMRTTFAVSRLLSESGMVPLKAENGERALRLLEEQSDVDMVLMDIMMPVMDGYETMKRIRAMDQFRKLPIIALTAKAMPEHHARCLEAGANDYLPKPIDQKRLFSMMRIWFRR